VSARENGPTIPELGLDGIPIRHELELELRLAIQTGPFRRP
jgi:hypothetical protein